MAPRAMVPCSASRNSSIVGHGVEGPDFRAEDARRRFAPLVLARVRVERAMAVFRGLPGLRIELIAHSRTRYRTFDLCAHDSFDAIPDDIRAGAIPGIHLRLHAGAAAPA